MTLYFVALVNSYYPIIWYWLYHRFVTEPPASEKNIQATILLGSWTELHIHEYPVVNTLEEANTVNNVLVKIFPNIGHI